VGIGDESEALDRMKALRADLRDLAEEVEKMRKRKANGDDVEQVVAKVVSLEAEMRVKFGSLSSQNTEMQAALASIAAKLDAITTDINRQRRDMSSLQDNTKTAVWQKLPALAYVFMAIGLFAILQLGIEKWGEFKGIAP